MFGFDEKKKHQPLCEVKTFFANLTYGIEQWIPTDGGAPWYQLTGYVVMACDVRGHKHEIPIQLPPERIDAKSPGEAYKKALPTIQALTPALERSAAQRLSAQFDALDEMGITDGGILLPDRKNGR